MKNNFSKSDIKYIAYKFDWSENEAKNAVTEFLEKPSFANSEQILRICIDADNPDFMSLAPRPTTFRSTFKADHGSEDHAVGSALTVSMWELNIKARLLFWPSK